MSLLLAIAGAAAPEQPTGAPARFVSRPRRRVIIHGRDDRDERAEYDAEFSPEPEVVNPVVKPTSKPGKAASGLSGYDGPSAKEIATAALLEASRRLSEDIAAKERGDKQARIDAESARMALVEAQMQAELAAEAVRRAQDEEALIALLLAM